MLRQYRPEATDALQCGSRLGGRVLRLGDLSCFDRIAPGLFVRPGRRVVEREQRCDCRGVSCTLLDHLRGQAVELLALRERQALVCGVAVQGVVEPPPRTGAG